MAKPKAIQWLEEQIGQRIDYTFLKERLVSSVSA